MKKYFAHSSKGKHPAQAFEVHVGRAFMIAKVIAEETAVYASQDKSSLQNCVKNGILFHDFGKLSERNREALSGEKKSRRLPEPHEDAGVAALKKQIPDSAHEQMMVASHHKGLPDIIEEEQRGSNRFRNKNPHIRQRTDQELEEEEKVFQRLMAGYSANPVKETIRGNRSVFCRLALSCVVDADYSETASNYGTDQSRKEEYQLKPEARLSQLESYVMKQYHYETWKQSDIDLYKAFRDSTVNAPIVSCAIPAGFPKKTAVMAYLLKQAQTAGMRRIFVVVPTVHMVRRTAAEYRKALTLPGEIPEKAIAEFYYFNKYDWANMNHRNALWKAPIVVTTAELFFETLSANKGSKLRRLHQLPGSMILIDEMYGTLPNKLLKLAWTWMQIFSKEWTCRWVLSSSSQIEFWKLINMLETWRDGETADIEVPEIVPPDVRRAFEQREQKAMEYCWREEPLSIRQLAEIVSCAPGPRLLVMSTAQNAAVMAQELEDFHGQESNDKIFYLSAALSLEDFEETVLKLTDKFRQDRDSGWILVTDCFVEMEGFFSFQTVYCEMTSMENLLRRSGNLNLQFSHSPIQVNSFYMQDSSRLQKNSKWKDSSYVLKRYMRKKVPIQRELCLKAAWEEWRRGVVLYQSEELCQKERNQNFPAVEKEFLVRGEDMIWVVADPQLQKQMKEGIYHWDVIQKKAIRISKAVAERWKLSNLGKGIYSWNKEVP